MRLPFDASSPAVPLRITVVTTQDVVASGITGLLSGRQGDFLIAVAGPECGEPDVVFYDVIGLHEGDGADLDQWVAHPSSTVIAVTRELRPELGAAAIQRGAAAAISLGASRDDFLQVIDAALTGHLAQCSVTREAQERMRPGRQAGLTQREAEVLGMIVRGMSNHEIADTAGLAINSIKSYIRSAYRKMQVTSRSQAVSWGIRHGFPIESEPGPGHGDRTPHRL